LTVYVKRFRILFRTAEFAVSHFAFYTRLIKTDALKHYSCCDALTASTRRCWILNRRRTKNRRTTRTIHTERET